jgi:beta-galactosidase
VKLHAADLRAIQGEPRLWGAFIWAMFDFAADARREGGKNGINDKGLVTRDRAVKKDVFYFYKANWSKEPVLHVCSQRAEETARATCTVVGFCNGGPVTLVVNGENVGTETPDAVNVVTWSGVPLREGENEVELKADGGLSARRRIFRTRL